MEKNIVLENRMGILLPFTSAQNYQNFNHMLRRNERKAVEEVARYLDSRGIQPYFGGGIPKAYIFAPQRLTECFDIDILGVAPFEQYRFRVAKELTAMARQKSKWVVLPYEGSRKEFHVVPNPSERYMEIEKVIRFDMNTENSRSIDLTLVSEKAFQASLK